MGMSPQSQTAFTIASLAQTKPSSTRPTPEVDGNRCKSVYTESIADSQATFDIDICEDIVNDTQYFQKSLPESEAAREELLQRNQALEKVLSERNYMDGTELNLRLSKRVRELQSLLKRQDFLRPFLSLDGGCRTELDQMNREKLNSGFHLLRHEFMKLLNSTVIQYSDVKKAKDGSVDLNKLLARVCGHWDDLAPGEQAYISGSTRLTQALIGAAVCEWVFTPAHQFIEGFKANEATVTFLMQIVLKWEYHIESICKHISATFIRQEYSFVKHRWWRSSARSPLRRPTIGN